MEEGAGDVVQEDAVAWLRVWKGGGSLRWRLRMMMWWLAVKEDKAC